MQISKMDDNVLRNKSYEFALMVSKLCLELNKNKNLYVFVNQLIKSGTSIGANVEEAQGCQSKNDFYAKISIAYKEALETNYWIRLLNDLDLISITIANDLLAKNQELLKILGKIRYTVKKNEK